MCLVEPFSLKQFHNQPASSTLHQALTELWDSVAHQSGGRLKVEVLAENNNIPGGDPEVLKQLVGGEIAFYAQMGSLFSSLAPVAEFQSVPFVFTSRDQVFATIDGELGDYMRHEMAAKGIHVLPKACFENGFHHISLTKRRVRILDDMEGLIIRTPKSPLFEDFFQALRAKPVSINISEMYEALKTNAVEAQQNPLAVIELFKLYQIQAHVSLTAHMWSGFNLVASLKCWNRLPQDIRDMVERLAAEQAIRQRREQDLLNQNFRKTLSARGMIFDEPDIEPFKLGLHDFYIRWKNNLGTRAWSLLEAQVGKIV